MSDHHEHAHHADRVTASAAEEHADRPRGHDRHAGHSVDMFRNRFWVCLVLTVPVLLYAEGLWELVDLRAPALPAGGGSPSSSRP